MHSPLPWWAVIILYPIYGITKIGDKIRQAGRKKYKPEDEKPEDVKPEMPMDGGM